MSSVVAETNSPLSSQSARPKAGQGSQSSGGDGFSGLVDSNLAATDGGTAGSQTERARPSAREGSAEAQAGRQTGIRRQPESRVDSAPQTSGNGAANAASDAGPADTDTTANAAAVAAVDLAVKTGIVSAPIAAGTVEAAPETDTDDTPVPADTPAPAAPTTGIVAAAVAVQIQLAAEPAATQVISSSEAIAVSNPPATIVAAPAETAANALARVALDTGDNQTGTVATPETETAAQAVAQPGSDDQASPVPADNAPAATPDVSTADAAPDAVEAPLLVETAAADALLGAKAHTELNAAAKAANSSKPDEAPQPDQVISNAEIKPARTPDTTRAAPEQPPAKPGPHDDRRVEADARTDTPSDKPAEAEARAAQRPAHEQTSPASTHAQAATLDQPQPTGFGVSHAAAAQTSNAAVQTAQLTAVPAANVPVPVNGLAVEIAANLQIGRSRFEIRLDPPELGRIDVRLDVDRHGQVTSHLIVEKSATLDLLRRDAPQLERALQDAGLKTSDSGLQFSLRDQQQQAGRNDDNGSQRNSQRLIVAEDETIAVETAGRSYGRMIGQRGGVDIRV